MRTPRAAAVMCLLLIVAGAGWHLRPEAPAALEHMPMDRDDAAARLRARASAVAPPADTRAVSSAPASLRDWTVPLASVYEQWRSAAHAGDMEAAHRLGQRLHVCWRSLRERTPDALLAEFERETGDDGAFQRDAESMRLRRENVARQLMRELDIYEDCQAIGEERASNYLAWLERAGASGHLAAQRTYAGLALEEYQQDRGRLIANIEEATRRRTLARSWLERQLLSGEEAAVFDYVVELQGHRGLYSHDRMEAAVYGYVRDLILARRGGRFSPDPRGGPPVRHHGFTAAEWEVVAARANDIFASHFASPKSEQQDGATRGQ